MCSLLWNLPDNQSQQHFDLLNHVAIYITLLQVDPYPQSLRSGQSFLIRIESGSMPHSLLSLQDQHQAPGTNNCSQLLWFELNLP